MGSPLKGKKRLETGTNKVGVEPKSASFIKFIDNSLHVAQVQCGHCSKNMQLGSNVNHSLINI